MINVVMIMKIIMVVMIVMNSNIIMKWYIMKMCNNINDD